MLDTRDAVLDALRANDAEPYGRARTVVAEELAAAAEQFDDAELLVPALLDLMEAYEYDTETRKVPVVFARILKLWDASPDAFGDWARQQVFWRFKWVASALLGLPEVPLESSHAWLAEMRRRYLEAGLGLQPYYAWRFHLADHTGIGREEAFELWAARPRAQYSDCEVCEHRQKAEYFLLRGEDERAVEALRPALDGRSICSIEPYSSQGTALLPLLRLGRLEEARTAHLSGYRAARRSASANGQIGLHLEFCALSGNEPRGLEILAENRERFAEAAGDPRSYQGLLAGVQQLTARLLELGHGGAPAAGPPGGSWTVRGLHEWAEREGQAIAERFDARNGTTACSDQHRARLARRPLTAQPLALGLCVTLLPATASTPEPAAGTAAESGQAAGPGLTGQDLSGHDLSELIRRARALRLDGLPDTDGLWREIARRIGPGGAADPATPLDPDLGPPELLSAELAERRAFEHGDRGRTTEARAELAAAADLYTRAGAPGRALLARARRAGRREEGEPTDWAELDEVLDRAAGEAEPLEQVLIRQCRAFAAYREATERPGDDSERPAAPAAEPSEPALLARFERENAALLAEARRAGRPHCEATAYEYAALVLLRHGDPERAEAELARAERILTDCAHPWRLPRVLLLRAEIRMRSNRLPEAVETAREALALAAVHPGERDFPHASAHSLLGFALASSGRPAEAAQHLTAAADGFDRDGVPTEAARTRCLLATLLRDTGRTAEAVSILESVLHIESGPAQRGGLEGRQRAQARLDLARGLTELGEHRDAAEEFVSLAAAIADWPEDEQGVHTMVACEAAVALLRAGRPEQAATAREHALAAHRRAPRADHAVAMLHESASRIGRSEVEDALPAALALLDLADSVLADAVGAGLPVQAWFQSGQSGYRRGRLLADAERYQEGLVELERAIAAYESGPGPDDPETEAPRAEAVRVAALVEGRLSRFTEARQRIAETVPRCRRAGLEQAVQVLGETDARLADGERESRRPQEGPEG